MLIPRFNSFSLRKKFVLSGLEEGLRDYGWGENTVNQMHPPSKLFLNIKSVAFCVYPRGTPTVTSLET